MAAEPIQFTRRELVIIRIELKARRDRQQATFEVGHTLGEALAQTKAALDKVNAEIRRLDLASDDDAALAGDVA